MITHVFICNKCDGDIEERIFELYYDTSREAEDAAPPVCPRCGAREHVSRFFGHNIFCKGKPKIPIRYIPYSPEHRKGILSIGVNISEEESNEMEQHIDTLAEDTEVEIITEDDIHEDPERILGIRKDSLDHKLFEIRQKKMIEELRSGKPISGFFLPLNTDCAN